MSIIANFCKRVTVLSAAFALAACSNYYKDRPDELYDENAEPFVIGGSKSRTASRSNSTKRAVPQNGSVKVVRGDTVYGISRRYDVPVRDIISTNRLKAPYTLQVGQTLQMPARQTYTVKRGDTGTAIASMYGVNVYDLMRENNIRRPYVLQVGQKLMLPGGAKFRQVASTTTTTASTTSAAPTTSPTTNGGPKVGNKKFTSPPRTSSRFSWPVRGRVISSYGLKADLQKNEGINIAAQKGASVRAAEDGIVIFASDALESYGNLLLVKHGDGWMTAYAHTDSMMVREGETVKKGQVIARVGSTGSVSTPQLHFEVRKGAKTYDPMRYLVSQSAATSR